ncbi:HNH endonuclease signature motif containing protein [Phenylobacterium sp.]|uniref:HNH endonuclease signature motif containing protein n=1 Tax=Phenylobacterium sp. TaxID=1871053 RepID=UPI00273080E5|nr:HNH endonuclease signature motif containing protein [Phenylobacterium sp.]MDP2212506.1 HNH endonuclease signature motif containing protein [Phenylobacterium sp.]
MPRTIIDHARLEGEERRRWFMRNPAEIYEERQARDEKQYDDFFRHTSADFSEVAPVRLSASPDDALWVATGSGGHRAVRPRSQTQYFPDDQPAPPSLLPNPAAPERGYLIEIGSRENRALKKLFIETYGFWPKTEDGRDYEVSHRRAIADGGKNTLSNIEPIHPDDHRAMHVREGDSARWARRGWIARAFGGRVEPPKPGPVVRGGGALGAVSNILGVLSGRVRTDTPVHFWYDMAGFPAPDDQLPKPGDII